MIRKCYRCGDFMGEKEPLRDQSITHGLCEECFLKEVEDIELAMKNLRQSGWLKVAPLEECG